MKLIVGLGNPGGQYDRTRHNAGFMVVDALASRHAAGEVPRGRFQGACVEARIGVEKCLLLKPTTYMNLSGRSVGEAVRFFKLEPAADLIVVVDDLALPVGQVRVRARGGSGGHNGLSDIDRALGGGDYPRVRVGIGKTPKVMKQEDWVLSRFADSERDEVDRSLEEAADAVRLIVDEGVDAAMNRVNRKVEEPERRSETHPAEEDGAGPSGEGPVKTKSVGGDVHPGWVGG